MVRNIALLCLFTTAIGLSRADNANDNALKALQGEWKAQSITANGNAVPDEQIAKTSMTIKDKELTLSVMPDHVSTIVLDVSHKPAWIDVTNAKKQTFLGIYELKDDSLKICLTAPEKMQPIKFESTKEGETALLVLKREKK
jgi:uncharacterized protein (TIGR03067 family)